MLGAAEDGGGQRGQQQEIKEEEAMRVYVAGASAEIDRAEHVAQRLREVGVEVASTWMAVVREAGDGNPRDATKEQRAKWAWSDLREVSASEVLLVLIPSGPASFGSGVEFGFAFRSAYARIVFSGDTKRSIFCALGEEYDSDDEAIAAIMEVQ